MCYKTIKQYATNNFVEKKSKFIGHIKPIQTIKQAEEFIDEIKQKYFDAKHNVYAYILNNGDIKKCSDDGEPQGSAGIPVLDVITKENLSNVCVVVTRYFGGVMLGAGGLVRAYSKATKITIDIAEEINMYLCYKIKFDIEYHLFGKLNHIISNFDTKIIQQHFNKDIEIEMLIYKNDYQCFYNKIKEISNGKIEIFNMGQEYYNIKSKIL